MLTFALILSSKYENLKMFDLVHEIEYFLKALSVVVEDPLPSVMLHSPHGCVMFHPTLDSYVQGQRMELRPLARRVLPKRGRAVHHRKGRVCLCEEGQRFMVLKPVLVQSGREFGKLALRLLMQLLQLIGCNGSYLISLLPKLDLILVTSGLGLRQGRV